MEEELYLSLCHSLAKASNAGVRLYHKDVCRYYYSVYHLQPDPAGPFLSQLLDSAHRAGVITTPLLQFYGFFTFSDDWRIIIGPSRMENEEKQLLEEQLFLLNVPPTQKEEYIRLLRCSPMISAEQMSWLIAFLASAIERKTFSPDQLYVNIRPADACCAVQSSRLLEAKDGIEETPDLESDQQSYEFEKLSVSYIQHGEPEKLEELFNAAPNLKFGHLSDDTLRQLRDLNICTATVAARAAIAGGVDHRAAFRLSDLYIQKIELVRDAPSLKQISRDIMVDFARQVQQIRYHTTPIRDAEDKNFFRACADYVRKTFTALFGWRSLQKRRAIPARICAAALKNKPA